MRPGVAIKPLRFWFRALFHWFWEAHLAWFFVGTFFVAVLVVVFGRPQEPCIRLAGLVFQVLGIGTVALGIHQTRKLFGHPGLWSFIRRWLARFPRYGGRIISSGGCGALDIASTGRARGYVIANLVDDTTEARLDALETNVEHLHERINGVLAELDQQARDHSEAIEKERQTRVADLKRLSDRLEATETGGLSVSALGVLWLVMGAIMSTAAPELAKWLR